MVHPDYLTAELEQMVPETSDTSSYLFRLENGNALDYSPGQFTMLGFPGFEEAAISFSSLREDGDDTFMHTIRRVGNVTRNIASLQKGDKVMLRGAFGRGWPLPVLPDQNVLMVAGGIGLAPVRPALLHCLNERKQLKGLALVYGARSPEDMVFKNELAKWAENKDLKAVYCVDEMKGSSDLDLKPGLVTQYLKDVPFAPENTVVYICGPEIMMRFVARQLLRQGYNENRIYVAMERKMRCGTAHCGHCQIGPKFVCQDGPVFRYPDIARFADTLL